MKEQNVRIYSLACGSYPSTRDRILFTKLLRKNIVPDVALFIGGMNDFGFTSIDDEIAPRVNKIFRDEFHYPTFSDLIKLLPVHKAARSIEYFVKSFRHEKHKVTPLEPIDKNLDSDRFADKEYFDFVINRYYYLGF